MNKLLKKLIVFGLAFTALFNTQCINKQFIPTLPNPATATETSPIYLKGTDIYNGLRGQSFNDGWKFNEGDVGGGQDTSYDDSSWEDINLPHDWSIFKPIHRNSPASHHAGYMDGGIGWYRKTFTIPSDYKDKKVFINFDGAYMNSQVWINGHSLGIRPYGYTSFEYDLSPYLVYGGENVIAVRINNNQPTSRWYSGSGIYRNVWLTVLNKTHVDYCGMFVTTPSVTSSSAIVNVKTKVVNQSDVSAHRGFSFYSNYVLELMKGETSGIAHQAASSLIRISSELNAAVHPGEIAISTRKIPPVDDISEQMLMNFNKIQKAVFSNGCILIAAFNCKQFNKLPPMNRAYFDWLVGTKLKKNIRSGDFGIAS